MDIARYASMLKDKALFFSRSDLLGDPFEGSYSKFTAPVREAMLGPKLQGNSVSMHQVTSTPNQWNQWNRQWTYVNCWHLNQNESAAMWKLYAQSRDAVAIRTTYERLCSALPESIYVGLIKYVDYEKEYIPDGNGFSPFMHKRKSFEHEHEVRALFQELPIKDNKVDHSAIRNETGKRVSADINALVEDVLVAPTAPVWFRDLVQDLTKVYGASFKVTQSSLDNAPVFA